MSAFDFFSTLSLFKNVEPEALIQLIPKISLDFATFKKGERVIDGVSEPTGVVYLLDGKVEGSANSVVLEKGESSLLAFTGLFGDQRETFMEWVALEDSRTLTIDVKSLVFLMQQHPAILNTYLEWLSEVVDPVRCFNKLNRLEFSVETGLS